ncbi:MAG: hypothetical protein JWN46_1009 [Acidimicrobiales bacterium]|nr:hypothetical protein [Acidimicrobiales bacterium]
MATHVAFLRAVNVGGRGGVAMPALRTLFEDLGHTDVRTCLQSGNVVFTPRLGSKGASLVAELEGRIAADLDVPARVVLRTTPELTAVSEGNPFLGTEDRLANLHVVFLADRPTPAAVAKLDPDRSPPDQATVVGREVYLRYPNGSGRSKLTAAYLERQLGTHATARNWNTVTKVLALMA